MSKASLVCLTHGITLVSANPVGMQILVKRRSSARLGEVEWLEQIRIGLGGIEKD